MDRWCGLLRRGIVVAALFLTAAGSGCNKSPIELHPVRGQVFYKDQPADGAQIVFQPQGEAASAEGKAPQPMAYGTVGADGSFVVRTEPHGEGAAVGDYNVMISWYAVAPNDPEGRVSRLPAKYADPAKPLLKATVKSGKNDLEPFRLN